MRVGFYDPYLSTLGGGEKYLLSLVEIGLRLWPEILLLSPTEPDSAGWRRLRIDIPPGTINWRPTDDSTLPSKSADLDLLVALHNYVPPVSRAKRSVLILQFPFTPVVFPRRRPRPRALVRWCQDRRSLATYDVVVAYSEFVRHHIASRTGLHSVVLSPPVDSPDDLAIPKEKSILAVGRFFRGPGNKKQDVLIDAFASLCSAEPAARSWTLRLAGGASPVSAHDAAGFVNELRQAAAGQPIEFCVNPSAAELASLYTRSRLFWHATGFGEPLAAHPERMEHFGITTVEAMSYGCVPLVFAAGGQTEIVDGKNGVVWDSTDELIAATSACIRDAVVREEMAVQARQTARAFEKDRFVKAATRLLVDTAQRPAHRRRPMRGPSRTVRRRDVHSTGHRI